LEARRALEEQAASFSIDTDNEFKGSRSIKVAGSGARGMQICTPRGWWDSWPRRGAHWTRGPSPCKLSSSRICLITYSRVACHACARLLGRLRTRVAPTISTSVDECAMAAALIRNLPHSKTTFAAPINLVVVAKACTLPDAPQSQRVWERYELDMVRPAVRAACALSGAHAGRARARSRGHPQAEP